MEEIENPLHVDKQMFGRPPLPQDAPNAGAIFSNMIPNYAYQSTSQQSETPSFQTAPSQSTCYPPNLTLYINNINRWNDNVQPLTFLNRESLPMLNEINIQVNKLQLNEEMQYLNLINNKMENDIPEYVDISSLMISEGGCKSSTEREVGEADDDVIFVKEYKPSKEEEEEAQSVQPAKEPRRNPKRLVQLYKMSYDLDAFEYYETGFNTRGSKPARTTTSSNDTTSFASMNGIFKEWPADGMHEKPHYNPSTKKLEKFPKLRRKPKLGFARNVVKKKPQIARKRPAKAKENAGNDDFAAITHCMLHYVLGYIEQLKSYNRMIGIQSVHWGNVIATNLNCAQDLLLDSCVMYNLAHDVSEASTAKYIDSISDKEDAMEFLNGVVNDCDKSDSCDKA